MTLPTEEFDPPQLGVTKDIPDTNVQNAVLAAQAAYALVYAASGGSSLELYYAGTTEIVLSPGFTDHLIENVDSCVLSIPASGSSRVFKVDASVTWDSSGETFSHAGGGGGHVMRVCLMLDGSQIWPYPGDTVAGIGPVTSGGEQMNCATISGAVITIPGDNASHTLSLAWSPSQSLAGFHSYGRGITAIKVA